MMTKTVVIISYYDRRPITNLIGLLNSLQAFDAGAPYDICVVVNRTSDKLLSLAEASEPIKLLYRHNTGMNIGAWDHAWRACPDYDNFVFLQDDCYVTKKNWLQAIVSKLACENVGLLGEAPNNGWDIPWAQLRTREMNVALPEHLLNSQPANRVDVYMDYFKRHNIPKGETGYHMRSLVWACKKAVMEQIDGFPHGLNYGECIAAEIAVTKKVQALGLRVEKIENNDFSYIRHLEWNQDYPGGPFSKQPTLAQQLAKLQQENAHLTEQIEAQRKPVTHLVRKLTRQTER